MMHTLLYRSVETSDLEKIYQLPQNAEELFFMFSKADYPLSVEQLQTVIENRPDSTVILLNNEIVGFANFYEIKEDECCSIGNVIVNSSSRNQGIGTFLIKTMQQIAVEKYNVTEIRLSCFNTNTSGISLYSKLGYIPYEIEKRLDKEGKPIALIKMKREL